MGLTSAQLEAVRARGNVIVVAGAGTGKTSTLVERVAALLAEGASVERLLMVTFTDAAAAEMRHRLRVRMAELAAGAGSVVGQASCLSSGVGESGAAPDRQDAGPTTERWEEQLALLDTARIGTLHSFCLQLIRENFHLLGIDPAVSVLDEQQTQPLIEAALDECLAPHFARTDATSVAVREVIRRYAGGDPERVRGLILKLHRHAQTVASPERWFGEQLAALEREQPEQWRAWLAAELRRWAEEWLPEVEREAGVENLERCAKALRELAGTSNIEHRTSNAEVSEGRPLTPALSPSDGEREKCSNALAEILAADAADWPKKLKTKLRAPFVKMFEEAEFFASQFDQAGTSDGLAADWENVRAGVAAMLTLAREFGVKYGAAKREQGGLDFGDLEQLALRLLLDGLGQPTAVAQGCRESFEHVFVDECQDINAAQDAIIGAVSWGKAESGRGGNIEHRTSNTEHRTRAAGLERGNGEPETRNSKLETRSELTPDLSKEGSRQTANRFLVGDVKQSIYQFRLAKPRLFRDYEEAWRAGVDGKRIALVENFRSHAEVIAFVNEFFAPLMREAVGGVEYEELKAGRLDGEMEPAEAGTTSGRRVEFCLLCRAEEEETEGSDDATQEDLLAVEREARTVALRLRELHDAGEMIWDKELKLHRRVEWRDMAVLLRSPRSRVEVFAKEFHKCGVPLQAERGGFLDSTEVSDLLSLVRVLDNPLQDIPLLAVLRSPLVAMTLDELAQIRIASKAQRLWTAVKEFHRKGTLGRDTRAATAWRKVDWFLQRFAVWRELARQASLSQCLERALADSHYEAVTQAGERGGERVANVRKFIALVRRYDPFQRQGVFRFLQFIESLLAAEQEIEPAPAIAQNAVRLMSIHKSKGLEFPVVAVACLGTRFNAQDLSADVLVDEDFGVCAKAVAAGGGKLPTFAHWLAARRQKRQLLGEELRLLYVAMTRARDRLILSGTSCKQDAGEWEADVGREFEDREILKAQSMLDWIVLWLPRVTKVEELGREEVENGMLRWRILREQPELPEQKEELAGSETGAPMQMDVAALMRRLEWRYPQQVAVDERAKTNVTALRRRAAELADEDAEMAPFARPTHEGNTPATTTTGLDAAARGTLHHEFLQAMSFDGAGDETDLRRQLAAMVNAGLFAADSAAAIDLTALAEFWRSDVGAAIRANAASVRRELPFTARFSPEELQRLTGVGVLPGMADEFVVVQGVADLVVMRPDEIWLLDFKTDRVGADGLDAKVATYRPQLKIYAAALEKIYRREVSQCWLHFVMARRTVAV